MKQIIKKNDNSVNVTDIIYGVAIFIMISIMVLGLVLSALEL